MSGAEGLARTRPRKPRFLRKLVRQEQSGGALPVPATTPRGQVVATLDRPGHLVSLAFRNDAATRCSEPVHSLRKAVFLTSGTAPADVSWPPVSAGWLQALGFDTVSDNQRATRDQLNTASIDGQDLAERMFHPAPIMTRVFGE